MAAVVWCAQVVRRRLLDALALDAPPLTPGMARVQAIVLELTRQLAADPPPIVARRKGGPRCNKRPRNDNAGSRRPGCT